MEPIRPDMVLDKRVVDTRGTLLGHVVDVGLFDHARVKFLVVEDKTGAIQVRRYAIDDILGVSPDAVRLRISA